MRFTTLLLVMAAMATVAFLLGRHRSIVSAGGHGAIRRLHSLPRYYGYYAALWCLIPGLLLLVGWFFVGEPLIVRAVVESLPESLRSLPESQLGLVLNDIKNIAAGHSSSSLYGASDRGPVLIAAAELYSSLHQAARWILSGLVVALGFAGFGLSWYRLGPQMQARNHVEAVMKIGLMLASLLAVVTTAGILLSVLFEAIRFFDKVPVTDFLFGLTWSPQTALRADQVGSSGAFGAVPLFAGTLLISLIAMALAMPVGLMTAVYLSEYAAPKVRAIVKPALEVLAGVPTVVYGYFAAITVAPLLREFGGFAGLEVSSESALGAGLVMGIMIIPFVSSLSDDVINAVPQAMRDGSYGLGATHSETVKKVVLPAALPGIVAGGLLAVSRAIGETMIVVMAAGLAANLTANPLEAVTTVTVQIVTLLTGDQEFDSAKTLAAFALGLVLFIVTLVLNVIALHVVRRYREQYE